jgi:hypothetical protein
VTDGQETGRQEKFSERSDAHRATSKPGDIRPVIDPVAPDDLMMTSPKEMTMTVYQNIETAETFTRESDRFGYTDSYDVTRSSKEELDHWLKVNGFEII